MAKKKTVKSKNKGSLSSNSVNFSRKARSEQKRLHHALFLYLKGSTKTKIARVMKVHPKTIGRWFKKVANNTSIDVHGIDYNTVIIEALEQHADLLKFQKIFALNAYEIGDRQTAYNYERKFEKSLRKRDRAFESFGIKFVSRLQAENENLKIFCAWITLIVERLEANLAALKVNKAEEFLDPYFIDVEQIMTVSQCPEMFEMKGYLDGLGNQGAAKYMDSFDLDLMVANICLRDVNFRPDIDNPNKFAYEKLFRNRPLKR